MLGSTRLVALTGWGDPGDGELGKGAGFDLHLTKPVSMRVIRENLPALAQPTDQRR